MLAPMPEPERQDDDREKAGDLRKLRIACRMSRQSGIA